ncbi:myelin regulatory factor-like protein isoform X3 [Aethina tumida]|uniref:myelin regulatory factor-like protein isoform X3 n=1 Tax=Aethina tumida TaxID=116153 RepID=UPI00096B4C2B|nr:myelin regulatory factor-like protein isoform X3 [Aethina tumida]
MDSLAADLAIQAILARGTDFVGGIDNEALDFSQLADFINNDGSQGNNSYFGESLNTSATPSGKLSNVIVENKRNGHSLPESPPDSSSEHPYSPEHGCEAPTVPPATDNLYTNIYKQPTTTMITPIIAEALIMNSHILVDQNGEQQLLENGNMMHGIQTEGMMLSEENNRQMLLTTPDNGQNYDRSLFKNESYEKNNLVHVSYSHSMEQMPRNGMEDNLCEQNLDNIQVYTNLQSVQKKRKLSLDSPLVKSEPEQCNASQLSPTEQIGTPIEEEYASSEACLSESQYQCIRFNSFQQNAWHVLCDQNLTELPTPHYRVDADKGFNFSNADDAFVCQKKNHFQITCHVQLLGDAQFVKTPEGFQKISSFHIHFYGVKHDCPTQTIRVEQSQSDRSKKPFHPVPIELVNSQVIKLTVGRLHFSETTSNNMRKKGKPNPEQRYFQLVVGLHAHTSTGNFPIVSHASQKIIVRASNPGQFESDVELCWQKGQTQDSIYHNGRVGINTDRPDESLVVHGNIKITGHIIQPSDIRAKKNIRECNTAEQLRNVQKLRVVKYDYEPAMASQLSRDECSDTGVIAQEVAKILPEAVRPAGDVVLENGTSIDNFLVVNKERIFMENIGAVKELCKVTGNLETRIDQLERINRRLNKLKRGDSFKSNSTVNSSKTSYSHKCPKHHKCKDEEFCSNKFIQIVIVVLVIIMALCLAAITALYLVEVARHSQYLQANFDNSQRTLATKRPTKVPKPTHGWFTVPPSSTQRAYREDDFPKVYVDPSRIKKTKVVGVPVECQGLEQNLELGIPCQTYCCAAPQIVAPPDLSPFEKKSSSGRNKTGNSEKNKISKLFHSNDIEKQTRQRRETYDDNTEDSNTFSLRDENQSFEITIQGRNFNTTLTETYQTYHSNFSYLVPISKYMPDEFVNLIFRSRTANVKEIEYCYNNYKQYECPTEEDRTHKVNENNPSQLLSLRSIIFEVDMRDFRYKWLTYRASLKQTQNTCKLSNTKLGLEFIEYNFIFYRHCD